MRVTTFQYAWQPGQVDLCIEHAADDRDVVREDAGIAPLGAVSHGLHEGICEICDNYDGPDEPDYGAAGARERLELDWREKRRLG